VPFLKPEIIRTRILNKINVTESNEEKTSASTRESRQIEASEEVS